jgi:citrate lyase subunit beta/citryl-CoA lyase
LPVDSVILDLGDPILVEAKEQSRINVVEAVKAGGYGKREVVVRVNNFDSPWGQDDIKAVANIGADAILFPNIESREHVLQAIEELDAAGGKDLPVMVMIESPRAVLHAEEIASASDRLACILIATSDLVSQLHARKTHERIALVTSLSLVILAARAYNLSVVDGITSDLHDMQSFEYACRLGRDLGFDGKSLVHPSQLDYSNDAYTPRPTELEWAQTVIQALAKANAAGLGTVVVEGKLVENHHVDAAKHMLNLSKMIAELGEGFD